MDNNNLRLRTEAIFALFKGMTFEEMKNCLFVINGEAYNLFIKNTIEENSNAKSPTPNTNNTTPAQV